MKVGCKLGRKMTYKSKMTVEQREREMYAAREALATVAERAEKTRLKTTGRCSILTAKIEHENERNFKKAKRCTLHEMRSES